MAGRRYHNRSYLQLLYLTVLLLPLLVAGFWYKTKLADIQSDMERDHHNLLTSGIALINRELGDIRNALNLLHLDHSLNIALDRQQAPKLGIAADVFTRFGLSIRNLQQVRWLDESGMEMVRVDIKNQKTVIAQPWQLQNKASRYYFADAMKTMPPALYFSPIDLNVEHGAVERPFKPTVRVAFHTGIIDPMPNGVLILNYDLTNLFKRLSALKQHQTQLSIADDNGYWLLSPQSDWQWGRDLNQPQYNLKTQTPALWQGLTQNKTDNAVAFKLGSVSSERSSLMADGSRDIFLLAITPAEQAQANRQRVLWEAGVIALVLFIPGIWLIRHERNYLYSLKGLNDQLDRDNQRLFEAQQQAQTLLEQQQVLQDDLVEARKLSSLGMMVAGVAHELNTPIGSAMMAISKQQSDLDTLKVQISGGLTRSDLDSFLVNAEQGLALAEQNLARSVTLVQRFKRLAIDRSNEDVVAFKLLQVANDLTDAIKIRAAKQHVTIVLDIPPEIEMRSQPGTLSQVLQNLITNALDHGFDTNSKGSININATLDKGWVSITVSDNGKGIEPSLIPQIFDPFVTTGRGKGNSGLGLHFVYNWVVSVLRGKVKVQSQPGQGTAFFLQLPQTLETPAL